MLQSAALFPRILLYSRFSFVCLFITFIGAQLPAHSGPVLLHGYLSRQPEQRCDVADRYRECAFTGTWNCITEVTRSNMEQIRVGTTVESSLRFVKLSDGSTVAAWAQQGWTDNCNSLQLLNAGEAQVTRENQGLGDNADCREVSVDRYIRTGPNEIVVISRVDMYLDGVYAGWYVTRSCLQPSEADGALTICHDSSQKQH